MNSIVREEPDMTGGDRFDLRRLRTLSEVARRGSFSAAADALNFTQSAVSQQIAILERQAGVPLLHRSPVSLTAAGEVVCQRAEAALAAMRAAEIELERLRSLRDGKLSLAAFASACGALLPWALAEFRRRHPNVQMHVSQLEVSDAEEGLRLGTLDLAITFEYSVAPLPDDPLIERAVLLTEPVYVAMRSDLKLARTPVLHLEDLLEQPWIQAADAGLPLALLTDQSGSPPLAPQVTFAGDDLASVRALVAGGLGIALLPGLAYEERPDIVFRRLTNVSLTRTVFVSTLTTTHPVPALAVMRDQLAASARRFEARRLAADQQR